MIKYDNFDNQKKSG